MEGGREDELVAPLPEDSGMRRRGTGYLQQFVGGGAISHANSQNSPWEFHGTASKRMN